jgi:hypothetical protein
VTRNLPCFGFGHSKPIEPTVLSIGFALVLQIGQTRSSVIYFPLRRWPTSGLAAAYALMLLSTLILCEG